jgi:DNA-binding transcriptional regulator GbsR (MarR family)
MRGGLFRAPKNDSVMTWKRCSRIRARVFSALLLSPDGKQTATELGELLGVGPSAISGGVNYLLRTGMAVREREPGQRRDHYLRAEIPQLMRKWKELDTHRRE